MNKNVQVTILVAILAVAATAVVSYYYFRPRSEPAPLTTIIMVTDWVIESYHTAYFVGKDRFYEEAGFDVQIYRGTGGEADKLAMGAADVFVGASFLDIYPARTQGMLVKGVSSINIKNPHMVYFVSNRDAGRGAIDPNDPKTLEGKIFGGQDWEFTWIQFPAFCAGAGIDFDTIQFQYLDSSEWIPALITGQIDMIGAGMGDMVAYDPVLEEEGLQSGYFAYKDYGVDTIDMILTFPERTIIEDPDLVRRFVEADQKAWKWTIENLDEAIDIFVQYRPEWEGVSKEELKEAFLINYGRYLTDAEIWTTHGVGYAPENLMEGAVQTAIYAFDIEEEDQIPWTDVFTNEYINPDIYPEPLPNDW